MSGQDPSLMQALQNPALYDHAVDTFRLIETHISWVLLTGPFAYKFRKAVDLGFVNFTSLERRKSDCEEELRLNRRLTPSLYVGVTRITGSSRHPRIEGDGEAFEYAVKMRQFDPTLQFDHLLANGRLTANLLGCFASRLARFHGTVARAAATASFGEAGAVWEPIAENFRQLRNCQLRDGTDALEHLEKWSMLEAERLRPTMAERKAAGFVRECHGDLHLGNIVLYEGDALAFDCLEFDANLRWIDVMNEVAFLAMDLDEHHHHALAVRFLNDYLHHTGDYRGLGVLRFYEVYRALVRAKVECLRARQAGNAGAPRAAIDYVRLAQRYTHPLPRAIIITQGLSGTGKTTLTAEWLPRWDAVRVRSDVERKRLAGLDPNTRTHASIGADLYGRTAGERTYRRLAELAGEIVAAGFPAVVDATFLKHQQRDDFRQLAARLRVPFVLLAFEAPEHQLAMRLRDREKAGRDASEADLAVLRYQQATQEPLSADERAAAIRIDTSQPDSDGIAAQVRERMTV